jgi:class 3 adenylate cyclase/CheY-like chemotaxis protein
MSDARPRVSTILAVDDTPANLSLLTGMLGSAYRVKVATSGTRALELAQAGPPDLFLLDIMMPGMSGYEVLERIRSDERLRDIPVIMVSAVDEIDSVIRCVELGAEDYLPKPFNPTLLRARIGTSLEKKRLRDEVRAQARQLADWNRELEQRVRRQVDELDRLGRLKGFFSPQVADCVTNDTSGALLQSHRREVVVAFVDMRGFTAFTDASEPEEVMRVLADFHRVMGQLALAHEGTLAQFIGDGLMIFFNDPVELANPALNAAHMALAMQESFGELRARWVRQGYKLDLSIGIAQGFATLGVIGFERRWEYACIGSVTNLAARLCSEARGGQILVDRKTLASIEGHVRAEPLGEVALRGLAHPVPVFRITQRTPAAQARGDAGGGA